MADRDYDHDQLALFDAYRHDLCLDASARPPAGLDPRLAGLARSLHAELGGPEPDPSVSPHPAFAASLRQRLLAEAERISRPQQPAYQPSANGRVRHVPRRELPGSESRRRRAVWRPVYWGSLAAVALTLIIAGTLLWMRDPNEVSARDIVERAQAQIESPSLAGIDSFRLVEVTQSNFSFDGPQRIEREQWYQAPEKWRIRIEETTGTGDEQRVISYGTVATGEEIWHWSAESAARMVQPEASGDTVDQMRFGPGIGLNAALAAASDCYAPSIADENATVAGRDAYVIDLGLSTCPSASMPETNGRLVIWVDKETFFVLKSVLFDARPGHEDRVVSETVVTEVAYNVNLRAGLFTPPVTATADDGAVTALPARTPATLEGFRETASYPIFVPTSVPAGFAPDQPEHVGGEAGAPQVRITYRADSGDRWLDVLSGPPGCCLSAEAGTGVTLPNGIPAHFISGEPEGGAGILWWVQDGAYVSIDSTRAGIGHEELLTTAASMSPTAPLEPVAVPESSVLTPEATPTVNAGDVEILYPGWLPLPSTVTIEERSDGLGGHYTMILFDHRPDDDSNDVLRLAEYPLEIAPTLAVDPRSTTEQIDGREVTVVRRGDGCAAMSWQQDGLALSLTNVYDPPGELLYTCEEMRRIVASIEPGASPPGP